MSDPDQAPESASTTLPDPAAARLSQLHQLLTGRRTINLFEPGPAVDPQLLAQAIEAARWAPNHRLTNPWHFHLLGEQSRAAVIELMVQMAVAAKGPQIEAQRRQRLQAVPGWMVLTTTADADPVMDQENYAACACAAQNLMLYLWQAGIGVKWTSGAVTRDARLGDILGVDLQAHPVAGLFWYGHPKMVPASKRAPVEDIVTHLP